MVTRFTGCVLDAKVALNAPREVHLFVVHNSEGGGWNVDVITDPAWDFAILCTRLHPFNRRAAENS